MHIPCLRFLVVFTFILTGCTTLSQPAAMIKDADMKMIENCQFLGDFDGSSGWGGVATSVGISNAKNSVREQAAKMGATHIVWYGSVGGMIPSVSGKAYLCK